MVTWKKIHGGVKIFFKCFVGFCRFLKVFLGFKSVL